MSSNKPRTLPQLLGSGGFARLEPILQRSRQLHRLGAHVLNHLDPELRRHCQVVNVNDGILILAADSNAWATRLRYQTHTLLEMLHEDEKLRNIRKIQIRVSPLEQRPAAKPRPPVAMSRESADCVTQCAEGIEDKALRQALKRLAQRGKSG
ncbi:MAG: DUF721 domain-containing protein [Pseudomonadota bacterium]